VEFLRNFETTFEGSERTLFHFPVTKNGSTRKTAARDFFCQELILAWHEGNAAEVS
jgi:hypothetical protein